MKINKSLIVLFLAAFSLSTHAETSEQPETSNTPWQRAKNHPVKVIGKTIGGGLSLTCGAPLLYLGCDVLSRTNHSFQVYMERAIAGKDIPENGLFHRFLQSTGKYGYAGIYGALGGTLVTIGGCLLYDVFLKKEITTTIQKEVKNNENK